MTDTPTDTPARPRDTETTRDNETPKKPSTASKKKLDPAVAVPLAIVGLCLIVAVTAVMVHLIGMWGLLIAAAVIAAVWGMANMVVAAGKRRSNTQTRGTRRTMRNGAGMTRAGGRNGGFGGRFGRAGRASGRGPGGRKNASQRGGKLAAATGGLGKKRTGSGKGKHAPGKPRPLTKTPGLKTSGAKKRASAGGKTMGARSTGTVGRKNSASLAGARAPRRAQSAPNRRTTPYRSGRDDRTWMQKLADARRARHDRECRDCAGRDEDEMQEAASTSPFAKARNAIVVADKATGKSLHDAWRTIFPPKPPDLTSASEPAPVRTPGNQVTKGQNNMINQFEQISASLPRAVDSQEALDYDALVPDYLDGFAKGFEDIHMATKMLAERLSGRDGMCSAGNPAIETSHLIEQNARSCVDAIHNAIMTLRRDPKMQDLLDRYEAENGARGDVTSARIIGG